MIEKYLNMVTRAPRLCLSVVLILVLCLAWFTQYFSLDASSDTLVVEGDDDLAFAREISERYSTNEFVFIAYEPYGELFEEEALDRLRSLRDELQNLERVESVQSIFDAPLLQVADVPLLELADNILTLNDEGVDLQAAKEDLRTSLAFRNVLISEDGETTALIVNFEVNSELIEVRERRDALRAIPSAGRTEAQAAELVEVEARYSEVDAVAGANQHEDIARIRSILDDYRDDADIVMSGVPMIADDLITFVQNDLSTFGFVILAFIILALGYLFRKPRYVLIPLLACLFTSVSVIGLLGLMDWPVTVVSSNFISLLLIITISLNVHLVVRYRELEAEGVCDNHVDRVRMTTRNMARPCLYTALTTIVAFGSLVISDIPPIVTFGWMMVVGMVIAFVLTFLTFPAVMSLLPESPASDRKRMIDVTPYLASLTSRRGTFILVFSAALFILSVIGVSRLTVENSFINYFDENTDIYRGMVVIDQNMGGTTPLDVIINLFPEGQMEQNEGQAPEGQASDQATEGEADGGEDEFFDDFFEDSFFSDEEMSDEEDAYWFTEDKMARIIAIHDYLEEFSQTGKVLSLGTLIKLAHQLNDGEALDSLELAVLYRNIPDEYKEALLTPYVSVENDQVRFSIRVLETDPDLVRGQLIEDIRAGLMENFGLEEDQVRLTGMFVLYNNMLQSLFESQILTLGLVLAVIFAMFVLLFRSFNLALLGIIPNIIAASTVLGLMGWLNIPLDIMTITIAAVSVGIGVDNTIHYVHRFQSQFLNHDGYKATMFYCHETIARGMYYTGFTVIVGFSILVLSNFIPTIYFGLLTSLAVFLALVGSLTLLPHLLIMFKPLGKE